MYTTKARNQLEKRIKILRSDYGGSTPQLKWLNITKNMTFFMRWRSLHTTVQ